MKALALPAWVHGRLQIPKAVLDLLAAGARASYDRREEACGFLRGPAGNVLLADEAVLMENLANRYHELDPEAFPRRADEYFLLNARTFQRAVDQGETDGRPVKVLWHSHLDVGAYFSESDAAAATMGGGEPTHAVAYLVTSVRGGVVDDHRLFVWKEGTFVESPFFT